MNNKYEITIGHPLVRPGLTIKTEASERYVVSVVDKCMELVRDINAIKTVQPPSPQGEHLAWNPNRK